MDSRKYSFVKRSNLSSKHSGYCVICNSETINVIMSSWNGNDISVYTMCCSPICFNFFLLNTLGE